MDVKVCDICKKLGKPAVQKSFFIGRIADAAGSSTDQYKTLDLCIECELSVMKRCISKVKKEITHERFGQVDSLLLEGIAELESEYHK